MSEMQQRLDLVREEIIDPGRRIVDPHHHFWRQGRAFPYVLEDLWADTDTGHNIEQTVFIECGAEYLKDGPVEMRPLGEVRFVRELAEASQKTPGKAHVTAMMGHANLGIGAAVEAVLQAEIEESGGLFRGIRHHATWDASADVPNSRIEPPPHLYTTPKFQEGFAKLAPLGLSFEAWGYHPQIPEVTALARAFPETTIVLNHFGTPIGIGPYANHKDEVFAGWKASISELAKCANVHAKLGGLAMAANGFGWDTRATPASSDEILAAQKHFYMHTIEAFGPERCLFESNFPVEKAAVSYPVWWNACKKLVAGFSETEKDAMFYRTSARVYKLGQA